MKVLVTGGGGFLGKGIVKALLEKGDDVRSLARGRYESLNKLGVEQIQGDIGDPDAVLKAMKGCEQVFHVAARAGVWGPYGAYYHANVLGTDNVINACRKMNVAKLIYTSSPSVVFNNRDQENVDESMPYPSSFLSHYPKTKAIAERLANQANSSDLATVSLRPHLIWGPGDNHLLPRIVAQAKAGKLRLVGGGNNLVDTVYIDNAVDAHILASDLLEIGSPISGKNYFITNGEPMSMQNLINSLLDCSGLPPARRRIPEPIAYGAGVVLESVYTLFGLKNEPRITRFVAKQLMTSHWFDISAARRDLGYQPKISMAEGFRRLKVALNSQGIHT